MTWPKTIWIMVLIWLITGCTIKIEPIPQKKPVKTHKHRSHSRPHRTPTPTPEPSIAPRMPMQLEPTDRPTPIIVVPPNFARNMSTDPLI
jgi:hypothetical protein